MSAMRELLAVFGVEVEDKQLKNFTQNTLGNAIDSLKSFGVAMANAFAFREAAEFIQNQIEIGSHLNDTAEKLGLTTDALQRFQYAAKLSGVDSDEAAHAIGFLNKNLGLALIGTVENAKVFDDLGIAIKDTHGNARDVTDVALDMADKFDTLGSQAERTAYATKILGREGATLLPVFKGGSKEVRRLFEEFKGLGGGMSGAFVKAADEAGDTIDGFKVVVQGLKSEIALAVLPTLTDWIKKLRDIGAAALKTIRQTNGLKTLALFMGGIGAVQMGRMAMTFAKVAAKAAGFGDSLGGVLKMLMSFGFIIAIIAALYLLFDELFTLMEGGDTIMGRLLDDMGQTQTKIALIHSLRDAWLSLKDALAAVDKGFKDIMGHFGWTKGIAETLVYVFAKFYQGLAMAVTELGTLGEMVGQLFSDIAGGRGFNADAWKQIVAKNAVRQETNAGATDIQAVMKSAGATQMQVQDWTGGAFNNVAGGMSGTTYATGIGPPAPEQNITQDNNNNITINNYGVPDKDVADKSGQSVRDALDRTNRNAAASLKTGAP